MDSQKNATPATSPDPRRWWALSALVLSVLVLGFDTTILNVALPTLSADLDASTSQLQWIVDAYVLLFAAGMLPAGALGDRFGRKRLLLGALAAFALASLAGTLATGPATVIAARACMGVAGAFLMPLSMSMLQVLFPKEERGKVIALWTSALALGLPLGPMLGGWLLDHFWWGSIFLINIPVVALAMLTGALLLPESRDLPPRAAGAPGGVGGRPPSKNTARRLDPIGALLSVSGLVLLIYGIIEAPNGGWTDAGVLSALGASVVLLVNFVLWELRTAHPMLDVELFRSRAFLAPTLAGTAVSMVMTGVLFVVPQYLQLVIGYDAFGSGLRLMPMMLGLMAGGLAIERLTRRVGGKPAIVAGLAVFAAGLGLGALTDPGSGYGLAATWMAVCGVGIGMALPTAMDVVLATLPEERSGGGSGLVQTFRQGGGAFGVAVLGSILSAAYTGRLDVSGLPGEAADAARDSLGGAVVVATRLQDTALLASARAAYVHGMDVVLAVCAGLALAGAALAWIFLPGRTTGEPDAPESKHEHIPA